MDVVGADVAVGRRLCFACAKAHDDQVFVDSAGRGDGDGPCGRLCTEVVAEVDAALVAEGLDGLAGIGIERP